MDGLHDMEVNKPARPVAHAPRNLPVASRDRLEEGLEKPAGEGIVKPVTEPTKWVSSLD